MILHDAFMTIHRAKYKLDFLKNREGRPTGMEYGFLKCCQALKRDFEDENMILCWEGRDNFRKQLYPDYKANRKKNDNPLAKLDYNRVNEFKAFLQQPFTNAEAEHFEADDVIASLVNQHKNKEKIIIWSNDKDLLQLVDERVTVVRSFQEVHKAYKWTPEIVVEKYHNLSPRELLIFFAFIGDKVDNIPGVPRLRKAVLASAIINARSAKNVEQSIIDYELWSVNEIRNIEAFVEKGYLNRNIELITLRKPDVIIQEATNDKVAIKKWLTMMEIKSLKLSKAVGMLEVTEDDEF